MGAGAASGQPAVLRWSLAWTEEAVGRTRTVLVAARGESPLPALGRRGTGPARRPRVSLGRAPGGAGRSREAFSRGPVGAGRWEGPVPAAAGPALLARLEHEVPGAAGSWTLARSGRRPARA